MNTRNSLLYLIVFVLFSLPTSNLYALQSSLDEVTFSPIATSVANLYLNNSDNSLKCTCVLIDEQWLATVAHCVNIWSDRNIPNQRDASIPVGNRPRAKFRNGTETVNIQIDRVVRVDGAETSTNSIAIMHLVNSAPDWSQPVPLYRGDLPNNGEQLEIFGSGIEAGEPIGSRTSYNGERLGGRVTVQHKQWRDIDKCWAIRINPSPSYLEDGDSGGPVFVIRGGRRYLLGVNWQGTATIASIMDIEGSYDGSRIWTPIASMVEDLIGRHAEIERGFYELKASHSNRCLDVPQSRMTSETELIQFDCNGTDNQTWEFIPSDDAYVIKAKHSGKCLTVPSSSDQNNTRLVQYECLNSNNQKWHLTELPNGTYDIRGKLSNKCVDVIHSNIENEANIIQFTCNSTTNQLWSLSRSR